MSSIQKLVDGKWTLIYLDDAEIREILLAGTWTYQYDENGGIINLPYYKSKISINLHEDLTTQEMYDMEKDAAIEAGKEDALPDPDDPDLPYPERIIDDEATVTYPDEPEEEVEPEESYPNEPIYLNPPADPTVTEAKKAEVLASMTEETRYPAVSEWLSSAEWATRHRELWTINHPTQAAILGRVAQGTIIGTGLVAAGGIGALAAGGGLAAGTITHTAAAFMGADTLMVWLAEDNILTGLGFTIRKLKYCRERGIKTKAEADAIINKVIEWADAAEAVVDLSVTFNPLLIPFKEILLANVEKSKLDLELEIAAIDDVE